MFKKLLPVFILLLITASLISRGISYFRVKNNQNKNQDLAKVIVILDWFPNTNHTGLYVAQDKNYFKENGLDVEIIQPAEGDNLQVLAAGKADFAISSQEAVTLARARDIPVVSIAAVIAHNTSAFASLEESSIKEVKDFEGKRYGGWGSPIEEATLKAIMGKFDSDFTKVKNITIGTNDFLTSVGRDSDFQWIFYGWDGIEAKRRGIDLNIIMLKDLLPVLDYYTPVIVTSENNIKNKKDEVEMFMTAVAKGYDFSIKNPDKSAEILIKNVPEINKELIGESQKYLSKEYRSDSEKWGIQKESVWQNYQDWLYENKLIDRNIIASDSFTNDFID